jgi:serine/threonine protein kinase
MTLSPGQTLSFYEILGPLGAGGMGEVYRARDTRLEREVAIKVLPDELADDDERLRRFEREAKTLASLNHPNVAGIHGVDQEGHVCFLALELVPGEDLATRLARGPLPLNEALEICRQIAEGLEAAHEAGVIHRDLKPANVRVTPEGVPKILDFGLAKPIRPKTTQQGTSSAESDSYLLTEEGLVLGTPTYMSPEQARGKPVDRRTDIWAFGCVLYECLAGRRAFEGESMTDVLAAIVGDEPDWSRLPAMPARVEELLRRALTKDPRLRLQDAGEARVLLFLSANEPVHLQQRGSVGSSRSRSLRSVVLTATLSLASLIAGLWIGSSYPADPGSETVSDKPSFHGMLHEFGNDESPGRVAISPDGTRVAWAEKKRLQVRALGGELEPRTIFAWDGELWGTFAWSPDGLEIAFVDKEALWRIRAEGGVPHRFADFDGLLMDPDLEWLDDGRIAYVVEEGIAAVSEGGERMILVEIDRSEIVHLHEFVLLPGGGAALAIPHVVGGGAETVELFRNGERKELVPTAVTEPGLVQVRPDGSLFWKEEGRGLLWRVPLSLEDFEVGESQLVAEECYWPSLSNDGALAYLTLEGAVGDEENQELGWVDRSDGSFTPLGRRHTEIWGAMLSADGRQIVFTTSEHKKSETWVHDVERGVSTVRITRDDGSAISLFFPDGRIGVTPITAKGTFVYAPSGKGDPELLDGPIWSVSPEGTVFVTSGWTPPGASPYYLSGPGVEGGKRLLLSGEHGELFHELSSDGEWMLYSSKRTGARQVFLTRFPPTEDEEWSVSAEGGEAAWFGDEGDEIFFVNEVVVHRVAFETEPVVRLGTPEPLFPLPANTDVLDYDGSNRFLCRRRLRSGKSRVYVDTDWAK